MKGSAYHVIVFVAIVIVASILWTVLIYGFANVAETMTGISTVAEVDTNIELVQATFYYSLFFIVFFGFIWVIKESIGDKNEI